MLILFWSQTYDLHCHRSRYLCRCLIDYSIMAGEHSWSKFKRNYSHGLVRQRALCVDTIPSSEQACECRMLGVGDLYKRSLPTPTTDEEQPQRLRDLDSCSGLFCLTLTYC